MGWGLGRRAHGPKVMKGLVLEEIRAQGSNVIVTRNSEVKYGDFYEERNLTNN